MQYEVELSTRAQAGLSRLDSGPAKRLSDKIDWLAENAESVRHEAMTGQFTGMFRIRAGDYRAIYELDRDNRKIFIDSVGHRSEVYRRR